MFKAGIAKVDITPPLGIRLAGYGIPERPAESVHDPLAATAIVFEQNDTAAAHVTLDLCLIEDQDVARMRELASQRSGIPADHINIGVSHTHSSPITFTVQGWGDSDKPYLDALVEKVAQVVSDARARCVPVRVGVATVATQTGVNRRTTGVDGNPFFGGNEHGPYDPTMTVVRFDAASGPVAVLIHCSAHPTAMGINRLVSRDWPGVMVDRVESQVNAPVIFINGTFGDVGPRTSFLALELKAFSAGTGDGIHSVNEVGYRAASDALRAWLSIKSFDERPALNVIVDTLSLPLAPLPSLEVAHQKLAEFAPEKDAWGAGKCNYSYWQRVIAAHSQPPRTTQHFRQTIISLGPLALVPIPGEVFTSIGLRLRRLSPFQHTLVCGGTNGMLTYLPDREARGRGGYEVWVTICLLTQVLADHVDDALVNENLKLLERLHKENA